MALVSYSDSEGSETDAKATTKPATKSSSSTLQKPSFHKLIDRSDPHKIKVTLPPPSKAGQDDQENEMEPPAKRMRVGGGGLADFNSFLPAPKKTLAPQATGGIGRKGLGAGISLKTGATPGFSREPLRADQDEEKHAQDAPEAQDITSTSTIPEAPNGSNGTASVSESTKPDESAEKKGDSMMFKPLSIARKPAKKKKAAISPSSAALSQETLSRDQHKAAKVSLFSLEKVEDATTAESQEEGYTPLVYEPWVNEAKKYVEEQQQAAIDAEAGAPAREDPSPAMTGPQRLDSIAADLRLSESAKRQLFGRSRGGKASDGQIRIANFNTDQEYAANELFRQAGEQQAHNPVRAIAAGKHSLKQLVNAVAGQKEALEEQFASGRRNKKEAGSRYGW